MKAVVWCCLAPCNEGVLSPNDLKTPFPTTLCSTATSQSEFNSDPIYIASVNQVQEIIKILDQNLDVKIYLWNEHLLWNNFLECVPMMKCSLFVCMVFVQKYLGTIGKKQRHRHPLIVLPWHFCVLPIFKSILDIQKAFFMCFDNNDYIFLKHIFIFTW